jgi:hypothetical protein
MSGLPILTRILVNTTRGNSKIYGNVTQPRAGTSGALDFAQVAKMLQTQRGSVANPGDTVLDLGNRFVLGYFSDGVNDAIFRMFRTPFNAEVTRMLTGKDPVTQLDRTNRPTVIGTCWYDALWLGLGSDFGDHKRKRYRIVTGFPLQVNDVVNDMKVTSVRTEQGVTIAEAE